VGKFLCQKLKKLPENYITDEVLKAKNLLSTSRKNYWRNSKKKNVSLTLGRLTISLATYARLMYLKFRYQLGYKRPLKEASDSFS
jgi:hypothetical protein